MRRLRGYILLFSILIISGIVFFLAKNDRFLKEEQGQTRNLQVRIGIVYPGGDYEQAVNGLKEGLKNLGYTEGLDVIYRIHNTEGQKDKTSSAVAQLIKEDAALIYTVSSPATNQVWKIVGDSVPIVFNIVGDPIGAGFIKSYASSGTNLTGCTNLSAELSGKRLEIFKEAFPEFARFATFYDPDNVVSAISVNNAEKAAKVLGVSIEKIQIKTADELKDSLAGIEQRQYDGFFLSPDALIVNNIDAVIKRADEIYMPIFAHEEGLADKGAVFSYGANFYQLGVQCADNVSLVLRGVQSSRIPVQIPRNFDLVVNSRQLDKLELFPSPEIIGRSDKVIK